MTIPFEATRSYVYRASRYELLPRIAEIARNYGDEPFLLREISKRVLAEIYTADQLEIRIKKAKSDVTEKMSTIFGFYIPFLAENLRVFENVGGGMFKNISFDEELAEADAVATDVEANDPGIIYAYSFPSIRRSDAKFPIKPHPAGKLFRRRRYRTVHGGDVKRYLRLSHHKVVRTVRLDLEHETFSDVRDVRSKQRFRSKDKAVIAASLVYDRLHTHGVDDNVFTRVRHFVSIRSATSILSRMTCRDQSLAPEVFHGTRYPECIDSSRSQVAAYR